MSEAVPVDTINEFKKLAEEMTEMKKDHDVLHKQYELGSVEITNMKKEGDDITVKLQGMQDEYKKKEDGLNALTKEANDIAHEVNILH